MKSWPKFLLHWRDILSTFEPRMAVIAVPAVSDLPIPLSPNTLFVVGDKSAPKWVVMKCPCGCGDRVDVNLMKARRPNWRITRRGRSLTLLPSLWRPKNSCGSHYWVVDSRIRWVRFDDEYEANEPPV